MKRLKNIINKTTIGLSTAALIAPLFATAINAATSPIVKYELINEETPLVSNDFLTNRPENKVITNAGGPNYQYQNVLNTADTNDIELYNRENVLSDDVIKIVRNENFYFNFIKSRSTENYRIMITPVDIYSNIEPFELETNFKETNGSALWIKDRLVVVGTNEDNIFLLVAYSQNQTTGVLTLEDELIGSTETNPELHALVNLSRKEITSTMSSNNAGFEAYETFVDPIYLSPVTDYSNTNVDSFEIVAWSGQQTMNNFFGEQGKKPILIKYNPRVGFISFPPLVSAFPQTTDLPVNPNATTPGTAFTRQEMLDSRIGFLTPIRDNFGLLSYFLFNFISTNDNTINAVFTEIFVVDDESLIVQQFSSDVSQVAIGSGDFMATRDAMDYLPYGLVAKGDASDATNRSNTTNILINLTNNAVANSKGTLHNLIIRDGQDDWPEILAPMEQIVNLGITNETYIDSYYYPNQLDLNQGIQIGIKYTGFSPNNGITRLGTITWKQPWEQVSWSTEALQDGALFYGYAATESGTSFYEDIAVTVWDNIYSAIGIYRSRTDLDVLPSFDRVREQVRVVTKDAITKENLYNTQIPANITVNDGQQLSPLILGQDGLTNLVQDYSIDFPNQNFTLSFDNFDFVQGDNNQKDFLSIDGQLLNYYQKGIQSEEWKPLDINLNITKLPTAAEIASPFKLNNISDVKIGYPSSISIPISEAYNVPGVLASQAKIIGYDETHVIQVARTMSPYISNLEATPDDFLGKLKLNFTVSANNGVVKNYSLTVSNFWGNVYIVAIVLGSLLIIGLIILIVFSIQRKKNKALLSESLATGFNLFKVNANKKKPAKLAKPVKSEGKKA